MIVKALSFLVPRRARPPDGYPIRATLLTLVFICVVPAAIVAGFWVNEKYEMERERITNETILVARNRMSRVDQELKALQSGLWMLSISPSLGRGDLAEFHALARAALKNQPVTNYVLTNESGRQVMNTLVPFGQTLPASAGPADFHDVFQHGKPVIADLFRGPVSGLPMVAIAVPVYQGSKVALSLSTGVTSKQISALISTYPLPDGWVAAVLDRNGTIIGRTREVDRYVGQHAVPALVQQANSRKEGTFDTVTKEGDAVITAFSPSAVSTWTVAVGAPKQALINTLYRSIVLAATGSALFLGLAVWLAIGVSRRVADAICGLVDPALSVGRGEAPPRYRSWMKEASEVGRALEQASAMLVQAQHTAHHDALTGLSNRMLFEELLAQELQHARRSNHAVAVLAVDLDGFKLVNDTHGHAAGDVVLKTAAARILGAVRSSDVAARFGGDEFAVLVRGDIAAFTSVAEKLREALSAPYPDVDPAVSASIGIAVYPNSGKDAAELLSRADAALYEAKRTGKRRVAIDPASAPAELDVQADDS